MISLYLSVKVCDSCFESSNLSSLSLTYASESSSVLSSSEVCAESSDSCIVGSELFVLSLFSGSFFLSLLYVGSLVNETLDGSRSIVYASLELLEVSGSCTIILRCSGSCFDSAHLILSVLKLLSELSLDVLSIFSKSSLRLRESSFESGDSLLSSGNSVNVRVSNVDSDIVNVLEVTTDSRTVNVSNLNQRILSERSITLHVKSEDRARFAYDVHWSSCVNKELNLISSIANLSSSDVVERSHTLSRCAVLVLSILDERETLRKSDDTFESAHTHSVVHAYSDSRHLRRSGTDIFSTECNDEV